MPICINETASHILSSCFSADNTALEVSMRLNLILGRKRGALKGGTSGNMTAWPPEMKGASERAAVV